MKHDIDLQMREWWVAELQAITKRVIAEEEKRQVRERRKAEKMMESIECHTISDLRDAYACGLITENKFQKLADLLENRMPDPGSLYEAKLELLGELYTEQKQILDDRLRFEGVMDCAEKS